MHDYRQKMQEKHYREGQDLGLPFFILNIVGDTVLKMKVFNATMSLNFLSLTVFNVLVLYLPL